MRGARLEQSRKQAACRLAPGAVPLLPGDGSAGFPPPTTSATRPRGVRRRSRR